MGLRIRIKSLFALLPLIAVLATPSLASAPVLGNPVLFLSSIEFFQSQGKQFTRYHFDVLNKSSYPTDLFASAPALPPCGKNTKSSRTWVDIYDQQGKRLYGFCALSSPQDLSKIWFALEEDVVPPSWIYIELTDRQTGTKYKSNLAETTE